MTTPPPAPLDLTPIRALRFNVEEAMRFYGMSIKRRRAIDVGLHAVDALLAEVEALRVENRKLTTCDCGDPLGRGFCKTCDRDE